MAEPEVPTGEQLQIATLQVLDELTVHARQMTEFVAKLDARLAGAMTVAEVVDENEDRVASENWARSQKDVISHFYGEAQRYVTVVIAGAYVAYFTTLSTVSERFTDTELRLSALLMTVSLTIFVLYEVAGMALISFRVFRGTLHEGDDRTAAKVGWGLAMFGTLATALPAVGLSLYSYLEGLGVPELIARLLG